MRRAGPQAGATARLPHGAGPQAGASALCHWRRPAGRRDRTFAIGAGPQAGASGSPGQPAPRSTRQQRESVWVGPGPSGLAAIERRDPIDLIGAQAEVEQLEVLGHPLSMSRLREHDRAAFDVPAEHDLSWRPLQLRSDLTDHGISQQRSPRAIGDQASVAIPCSSP